MGNLTLVSEGVTVQPRTEQSFSADIQGQSIFAMKATRSEAIRAGSS